MTFILSLLLWLVAPAEVPEILPPVEEPVSYARQDSVAYLSKVWILRERILKEKEELVSVRPVLKLILSLHPDKTYQLIQENDLPNAVNGAEVVEEGIWELDEDNGYIGVQVTQVDGRAIRSALAYRWQIARMLPSRLVLSTVTQEGELLVFEEKHETSSQKL
ncbi:hypothetical protein [Pontibacter beigongshangensis]|uniref:hypothetical protein n=1 Tax=Pontibacter beigongshangensis TaxID=2574733 RepID=UPI00165026C5|nr:hypothetical protein [Pontibacter beigongshangensis]